MAYQKKGALLNVMGLDVSKPAEYIDDRAASKIKNMSVEKSEIFKRIGTSSMGATLGEEVMYMYEFIVNNTRYITRTGLTKFQLYTQATDTWSDVANTALTGTTDDVVSATTSLLSGTRVMIYTNFKDNIRKYTGTGNDADLGGTPPKAKYLMGFNGYLVLAHILDGANYRRMRVQWSDSGDIETWTGGNTGASDLMEDGEDITGLHIFNNYVSVHKRSAIYLGYNVSSSDVFRFERKNTGVGTICNNTIQFLNTGEQIFLATDGIRVFNGTTAPLIESPVMEEIRTSMNPAYLHKCWSRVVPEQDEYWVAVPIGSQTTPDTIYKFNYMTRQCYKDERTNITACGIFQKTDAETWEDLTGTWDEQNYRWDSVTNLAQHKTIMFGDSAGISTKRDSTVNDDNGTAITAYWESKDFESDDKGRMSRWLELHIWAKGSTMKIEYSTDRGDTWTEIENKTLASDYPSDSSPLISYFDVVSSKIRFRFSNNISQETFTMKQFTISYLPREIRK